MRIQNKIFLVIFPLLIISLSLIGFISALSTQYGLTKLGMQNESLKSQQIEQYINEQWSILTSGNVEINDVYLSIFERDFISYAANLVSTETEIIFAIDSTGTVVASTNRDAIAPEDAAAIRKRIAGLRAQDSNLRRQWLQNPITIKGERFIGSFFYFEPLNWVVLITESYNTFFQSVYNITYITIVTAIVTLLLSIVILVLFTRSLLTPVNRLIGSMHNIIKTNNLEERVPIIYKDEIGVLSHTFNVTIEELEKAYKQIRSFAFKAVLAKRQENKIRNIFQKYVPASIINTLFEDPTHLLVGEKKELAILFTDIRGFTTISESYSPEELVAQLNTYFERTVNVIIDCGGIIDKYIGDAIMAFFGAPAPLENSSLSAVQSALGMQAVIDDVNRSLREQNKPEFITGIGISYGEVTVGNIGSEKKMDYTVIGDVVNLGSRLESLTKQYKQNLIFSSAVCNHVRNVIPCRMIDIVQVKGKTLGEPIFTAVPHADEATLDAFALNNEGIRLYLLRDFAKARAFFEQVLKILPNDFIAKMYIERCTNFMKTPPSAEWNGVFVATTK